MRKLFLLLILITGTVLIAVSVAPCVEKNLGPADFVIDGGRFGSVPVPHRVHQETLKDCNLCHRLFPQISGSILRLKKSGKLEKRQVMNQCTDCHQDRKRKGEKAGPTSCSGCHSG